MTEDALEWARGERRRAQWAVVAEGVRTAAALRELAGAALDRGDAARGLELLGAAEQLSECCRQRAGALAHRWVAEDRQREVPA